MIPAWREECEESRKKAEALLAEHKECLPRATVEELMSTKLPCGHPEACAVMHDPQGARISCGWCDDLAALRRGGWVKRSERMPEHQERVLLAWTQPKHNRLVRSKAGYGHFDATLDGWYCSGTSLHDPSHWMPLPSPPDEKPAPAGETGL